VNSDKSTKTAEHTAKWAISKIIAECVWWQEQLGFS